MSKKICSGDLEIIVYDYGRKVFDGKGKKKKVMKDFEEFKGRKGL